MFQDNDYASVIEMHQTNEGLTLILCCFVCIVSVHSLDNGSAMMTDKDCKQDLVVIFLFQKRHSLIFI